MADGLRITIAAAIDDERLVPAAEQMPEQFVRAVEAGSVGAQKQFHAGDEVGLWRFDLPIPEGAKWISLVAMDAGDGSCEAFADWANAGFVVRK